MPQSFKNYYKTFLASLFLMLIGSVSWAQDSTKSVTTTHKSSTTTSWYVQPWVWVVGAVVLIIILIALFRGKGASSTTTSRTTVIKERDV